MPSLGFLTRLTTNLPFLPHNRETSTPSPSSPKTPFTPLPPPIAAIVLQAWDAYDWDHSSDALAAWLNARWAKSGYSVRSEVVCFTLRVEGRDARVDLGDENGGAFVR